MKNTISIILAHLFRVPSASAFGIANQSEMGLDEIQTGLRKLQKQGLITPVDFYTYTLTDQGRKIALKTNGKNCHQ